MVRLWRGRCGQMSPAGRLAGWRKSLTRPGGWTAVAAVAAALVLTLVGVAAAGVFPPSGTGTGTGADPAGFHSARAASHQGHRHGGSAARSRTESRARPRESRARPKESHPRPKDLRTSCRSVAHIGDSTSLDLISSAILPDPAQRLQARYADVGVRHQHMDASGGRSIVEVLPGQVNGYNVARAWRSEGYRGCWVFALGTNDTANVAVDSSAVGLMARIERMMSVAHGEPVMWVNTRTELSGGPWAQAREQLWDATLIRALRMYPNMRIFDWAAVARPSWFLPDGIHYTSAGCAHRARAIADALARAFASRGRARSRVVR
jgi:hypothetical protein